MRVKLTFLLFPLIFILGYEQMCPLFFEVWNTSKYVVWRDQLLCHNFLVASRWAGKVVVCLTANCLNILSTWKLKLLFCKFSNGDKTGLEMQGLGMVYYYQYKICLYLGNSDCFLIAHYLILGLRWAKEGIQSTEILIFIFQRAIDLTVCSSDLHLTVPEQFTLTFHINLAIHVSFTRNYRR